MSLEALLEEMLIESRKTNALLQQLVHLPSEKLYPLKQAAPILGISYSALVNKTASGEWPSRCNGKRRLVSLDEIKAAMKEDCPAVMKEEWPVGQRRRLYVPTA